MIGHVTYLSFDKMRQYPQVMLGHVVLRLCGSFSFVEIVVVVSLSILALTNASFRFGGLLNAHIGSSLNNFVSVLLVCKIGQYFFRVPMMFGLHGLYVVTKTCFVFVLLILVSKSCA